MSSPKDFRKGRMPGKEGSKDPNALQKGCVVLATAGSEVYSSLVDEEDLSLSWLAYRILDELELELPGQSA